MNMHRLQFYWFAALLVTAPVSISSASTALGLDAGPLDQPLPVSGNEKPGKPGVVTLTRQSGIVEVADPVTANKKLRKEVIKEQKNLEKLDRNALKQKAENGERAAQVVLGADFAKEATLLSFAPAAANDALSDAARWYSLAASRGFPGAPSLDQSGIRFYPIRVHRERRP